MPSDLSRRARKQIATRQHISDIATRLFIEHGFDAITMDQVAEAADVSRMTVFNHFPRKEDLFFDLDEAVRADLLATLQDRAPGTSPVQALRHFIHSAVALQRPYVHFFSAGSARFVATIQGSEALRSRARAIRDEFTTLLTQALAAGPDPLPAPAAHLAASLLVATATVALSQAYRHFQHHGNVDLANRLFLAIIDQGSAGAEAALTASAHAAPAAQPHRAHGA